MLTYIDQGHSSARTITSLIDQIRDNIQIVKEDMV
jgi:hypothetical protein